MTQVHTAPQAQSISAYLSESTDGLEGKDLDNRREDMLLGRSGPLIDRSYTEAVPYQYLRELVRNAIEAKMAAQDLVVTLHPDWLYAKETGDAGSPVYRLMVEDNGCGMDGDELKMFFRSLSLSGGGKMMGVQDNFGMGAKISTMPANPNGVYVMSWKGGDGNMIRLFKGSDGEYGLWRWEVDDGEYSSVVDPPDVYETDADGVKRVHGTALLFTGDADDCDTYLSFPGVPARGNKTLSVYLNKRFFRFPDGVRVQTYEFMNSDPTTWDTKPGKYQRQDGLWCGGQYRNVEGQKFYLDRFSTASGSVRVTGATVHWWVIDDPNNLVKAYAAHGHGHSPGYISALYKDEMYNEDRSPGRFRQFGIFYAESRKRVTVVVEPDYTEDSGVATNGVRSELVYLNSPDRKLPWGLWGAEFMAKMPSEVKSVCENQGIDLTELDDVKKSIKARAALLRERILERKTLPKGTTPKSPKGTTRKRKPTVNPTTTHGRTIPNIEFLQDGAPEDRDRPAEFNRDTGTLYLFLDHPIFRNEVQYWCKQYDHLPNPGVVEKKVTVTVADVYAFSLVAKLVHATAFKGDIHWKDDAYDRLLSPEALTMAVLGKFDGENIIKAKLSGALGKMSKA